MSCWKRCCEDALERIAHDAVAPRKQDRDVHAIVGERLAERDEPRVRCALLARKIRARAERLLDLEVTAGIVRGRKSREASFEDLEVVPIHGEDVVQRRLDRREEARARRGELLLRELAARVQQPVVRPGVVVGFGGKMSGEGRGGAHDGIVTPCPDPSDASSRWTTSSTPRASHLPRPRIRLRLRRRRGQRLLPRQPRGLRRAGFRPAHPRGRVEAHDESDTLRQRMVRALRHRAHGDLGALRLSRRPRARAGGGAGQHPDDDERLVADPPRGDREGESRSRGSRPTFRATRRRSCRSSIAWPPRDSGRWS